ncbi:MAG: carboxypeptidase regulatory-like domain-containing protein [Nitrospinae bacterium]|nr:carboxypeptidase regulatory-like domain-containing protein [Nitrospinota bacterium]
MKNSRRDAKATKVSALLCFRFPFLLTLLLLLAFFLGEGIGECHNSYAGYDCLSCHWFSVAGTIYQDKDGRSPLPGADIKIEDANGYVSYMWSNEYGNFGTNDYITSPYTITVTYNNREVIMRNRSGYGGCNACHVQGSAYAAGAIFINEQDHYLKGSVIESVEGTQDISYERDIKPILAQKCTMCHNTSGMRNSSPMATYAEATSSSLLTPGSVDSLLIQKLDSSSKAGTMWPYLNDEAQFKTIKDWIVSYNAMEKAALNSGGPVPLAKITLSKGKVKQYEVQSNRKGTFAIPKVKAGLYKVTVLQKDYYTDIEDFRMDPNNPVDLTIYLKKRAGSSVKKKALVNANF